MKKLFLILLFILTSTTFADSLDQQLQKTLDQYRTSTYQYPAGMAMSVSIPGEAKPRSYFSGTVAEDSTIPISANNIFGIASLTKSFVAAIILQLESENKLTINDPLSMHLFVCDNDPAQCLTQEEMDAWGNITLKQLMNMTSGIADEEKNPDFVQQLLQDPSKSWTPAQMLQFAINQPRQFPAGQSWGYSNTNYMLLGMAIRHIEKEDDLTNVINRRILYPLALKSTFYFPYSIQTLTYPNGNMPRQYIAEIPTDPPIKNMDMSTYNLSSPDTAGAIISNATDLITWVRALFSGKVLPAQQFTEMKTLVCTDESVKMCAPGSSNPPSDAFAYGLGLQHYDYGQKLGGEIWYYLGSLPGNAFFLYSPKTGIAFTITSNIAINNDGSPDFIFENLSQQILSTILNYH